MIDTQRVAFIDTCVGSRFFLWVFLSRGPGLGSGFCVRTYTHMAKKKLKIPIQKTDWGVKRGGGWREQGAGRDVRCGTDRFMGK